MAKKKTYSGMEMLGGAVGGALVLWIFIAILLALLDVKITDFYSVIEGDTEGQAIFYNFLILYGITVILMFLGSFKMLKRK